MIYKIDNEYIEKGIITLTDGVYNLTELGENYGLMLIFAIEAGEIEQCELPEDTFEKFCGNNISFEAIDWIVDYISKHEFNPRIYELAQKM